LLLAFWLLSTALPGAPPGGRAAAASAVYFDDTAPDVMRLGNVHYELVLSKTNGAILDLTDKAAGASLTLGSRGGCLWGAVFPESTPDYVGGCLYNAAWANRFAYAWDLNTATLTLSYTWDPSASRRVDATVTIVASDTPFFDLQLTLQNDWGGTLKNAILPSDLLFTDEAVGSAYGPFLLPGVRLTPGFFTDDRSYVPTYPSDAAFADYLALDVNGGRLAVYTVNPDGPLRPVALGFVDNDTSQVDTFFSYHSFHTWVPDNQTWTSPTVRFRVGQSPAETILAYRAENHIAAYPPVAQKLGSRFSTLAHAPLIRADIWHINKPFQDWIPDLDRLPRPALLHPVAFQPRGHDENYPDFLPPDPRWGTTADFRAMVEAAQARNLLVMPYINPTWWDDESPTLQNLPPPLTAADVAVQDESGQPVYETYSGRGGYAVSPHVPFVQQRLAQLMAQWRDEVPADCVFEDQIGARVWRRDFNPAAPNPQSYSQGWLAHTALYADRCLMTEMGWDRLAETGIGFHGSVLTWAREFDYAERHWGAANWETYPLALWLLHDKVLLYQHDLSLHTMSEDRATLTWNLAYGYLLSYNWQWADNDPLNNPWLDLVAVLQRTVAARYAGQPLTAFEQIGGRVTRTTFGDLRILANWDPMLSYAVDGHRVAPGGFLVTTDGGELVAGVFAGFFNDSILSAGEHYVIIERMPQVVTVYHPVGETTVLAVDAPAAWQPGEELVVRAYGRDGVMLGEVPSWGAEQDGKVRFTYRRALNGQAVAFYQIGPRNPACAFDLDGSGTVDGADLRTLAGRWHHPAGPPYDVDGDGMVTVVDVMGVAVWWGEGCVG